MGISVRHVRVEVRHNPSFAVARLLLASREPARVESAAMLATSYGVLVEAKPHGGLFKSVARAAIGGDSFHVSTYTAPASAGWVDVAPHLPGDVQVIELDGTVGWCITKGCWLASAAGVGLETRWSGFTSLFGGEGGFLVHAAGHGCVVVSCYGAVEVITLPPGELVTVDTGHVVAYVDTVQTRVRPVRQGATQSMKSGQGLVFDFAGPGRLITQTRSPRGLASWLQGNGAVGTRA
jgi:uncharacterized protein (TIGR00266 family)